MEFVTAGPQWAVPMVDGRNAYRMPYRSSDDLARAVDHHIPEAASLEFKRDLPLSTRPQRAEALKDLTGIGNGGGGTVLYGIEERDGEWPTAGRVEALTDFGLQSQLEDIVRAGVHPPLIADYHTIEVDGGFVLVVEVLPSPLGPYMVEGYGERRYYMRTGTKTMAMTEQQVRDAYALARRGRERRSQVWEDHGLPLLPPTGETWTVVSALPEEPFADVLDLRLVTAADLLPPQEMATYINNWQLGDLTPVLGGLTRWADGYHAAMISGEPHPPAHMVRLYRDGAAAVATRIRPNEDGVLSPIYIARVVNTALLYLGWLWARFGLIRPVELAVRLHGVLGIPFEEPLPARGQPVPRVIAGPAGVQLDPVTTEAVVLPWELRRASIRHRQVMAFADRLHQAFGLAQAEVPFRRGLLHDRTGAWLPVSLGGDTISHDGGNGHIGWVHDDGSVSATRTGSVVGWCEDGVLVDPNGDAVAVLELAPGSGCPDDFVGSVLHPYPGGSSHHYTSTMKPLTHGLSPPAPTGQWSTLDLLSMFDYS